MAPIDSLSSYYSLVSVFDKTPLKEGIISKTIRIVQTAYLHGKQALG